MKNILLPTDFSENAANALTYAREYLEHEPCRFFLLHVVRKPRVPEPPDSSDEVLIATPELLTARKRRLGKLIAQLNRQNTNPGHRFTGVIKQRYFIEGIREMVSHEHIDLIVTGTKGASNIQDFVMGTHSGDIITKVKCNTLVVPQQAQFRGIANITFPTDYNLNFTARLLEPVSRLMLQMGATVQILHITKKSRTLTPFQQETLQKLKNLLPEAQQEDHQIVNPNLDIALQAFLTDKPTDLLVLIAKNLNFLQQLLFAPRLDKINYHLTLPFIILHS